MKQISIILTSMLLLSACNFVKSSENQSHSSDAEKVASNVQPVANLKGVDLIKSRLERTQQLKVSKIEPSKVGKLFEVHLKTGEIVYTDEAGSYFFAGDVYQHDKSSNQFVNVTEAAISNQRAERLNTISKKDTISFAPTSTSKSHIYVFTDVDCYYCQKLHQEVPALNKAGLEVRYLAFPRAGLNSGSYKKIQSAWCSKEKQDALTKLKNQQSIPNNICDNDAVAKQYIMGQEMGVRGTPAIITETGELISGYLPAKALLARLHIK